MENYIENMKQKPEHVRRRFAFFVSSSVTLVILMGWLASYSLQSSPALADKDSNVDAPVSSLTATVLGAYDDVKNMILGSNKIEYSKDIIDVKGGKR